jgi:hypothetical protein
MFPDGTATHAPVRTSRWRSETWVHEEWIEIERMEHMRERKEIRNPEVGSSSVIGSEFQRPGSDGGGIPERRKDRTER